MTGQGQVSGDELHANPEVVLGSSQVLLLPIDSVLSRENREDQTADDGTHAKGYGELDQGEAPRAA